MTLLTKPKNIILIRHGYSQANEIQKQQEKGLLEETVTIPDRQWKLTEKGKLQAQTIGNIFHDGRLSQIDAFYVSPYKRTIETASHLAIKNAHWTLLRDLRERSWGDIDTLPKGVFEGEYPRNYRNKTQDPLYWMPPSGESIAGVADIRVKNVLRKLDEEHAGENIVMVTHHDFILATRLVLEHMTDEEFTEGIQSGGLHVPNGSAVWFSRVNPHTGRLSDDLSFVRSITPEHINGQWVVKKGQWKEIKQPEYSNSDLTNWKDSFYE